MSTALAEAPPDLIDRVRLLRSPRVGPATYRRLIGEHGSAAAALDALPAIASAAGVRRYTACAASVAVEECNRAADLGARALTLGSPSYPPGLAEIDDAPPLLWALGDPTLAARRSVALVGARNASALGRRMAAHLARDLGAEGRTVVSGLARGIDTAAHKAALETGTIAVLAGGLAAIYPRENEALAREIGQVGLLLTEMPPDLQPQARHFPRRNRLISGLTPGLVVVEGAAKSGSLITARTAADQGRDVMAVPGHPFDARAAGCNALIRDGATLVRSAADVTAALDRLLPETPSRPTRATAPSPSPTRRTGRVAPTLLNLLGPAPVAEDVLIRECGHAAPEVLAALAELDLTGEIERHPGGLVSRRAS